MAESNVSPLYLPEGEREKLAAEAEKAYPGECCGLLVGAIDGEGYRVAWTEACRNLRQSERDDRFELDPRDFLRVDKAAREAGLEVIGVYHSHPDHAPRPSRFDAAAAHPGFAYVIVAVRSGRAAGMRSWLLDLDGGFDEQPILFL